MTPQSIQFDHVPPARWERIKAAAAAHGLAINADAGEAERDGIRIVWEYAAERLVLRVLSKPWYIPIGKVFAKMREEMI